MVTLEPDKVYCVPATAPEGEVTLMFIFLSLSDKVVTPIGIL